MRVVVKSDMRRRGPRLGERGGDQERGSPRRGEEEEEGEGEGAVVIATFHLLLPSSTHPRAAKKPSRHPPFSATRVEIDS